MDRQPKLVPVLSSGSHCTTTANAGEIVSVLLTL